MVVNCYSLNFFIDILKEDNNTFTPSKEQAQAAVKQLYNLLISANQLRQCVRDLGSNFGLLSLPMIIKEGPYSENVEALKDAAEAAIEYDEIVADILNG